MKLTHTLLLILSVVLMGSCNITSQDDAIAFNDAIIDEQLKLVEIIETFNEDETFELQVSLDLCKAMVEQCEQSIKTISQMKAIEGGERLKASAITYFEFYKRAGSNGYVDFSHLICKEDYSEEEYDQALKIEENILSQASDLEDNIIESQRILGSKYNFALE